MSEDREGYEVSEQGGTDHLGRPVALTYSVLRLSDGFSLGTYASQGDVDLVILMDRKSQEPQDLQ